MRSRMGDGTNGSVCERSRVRSRAITCHGQPTAFARGAGCRSPGEREERRRTQSWWSFIEPGGVVQAIRVDIAVVVTPAVSQPAAVRVERESGQDQQVEAAAAATFGVRRNESVIDFGLVDCTGA